MIEVQPFIKANIQNTKVSFLCDGWTNPSTHVKYMSYYIISRSSKYQIPLVFYHSTHNTPSQSEAYLVADMVSIIHEIQKDYECTVISIVTDNESTMTKVKATMQERTGVLSVPCCSHLLNLIINGVMRSTIPPGAHNRTDIIPCIKTAMNILNNTLSAFRSRANAVRLSVQSANFGLSKYKINFDPNSSDFQSKMTKECRSGSQVGDCVQKRLQFLRDKALCLIRPVDTRWKSWFSALERMYLLRPALEKVAHDSKDSRINSRSLTNAEK